MNRRGCKRFWALSLACEERELTVAELQFQELHRASCPRCALNEDAQFDALSALRLSATTLEPSADFDERLMERLSNQRWKRAVGYWSPALLGAAVAAVVALFTIDLLASTSQSPSYRKPFGEARRIVPTHEFNLHAPDSLTIPR